MHIEKSIQEISVGLYNIGFKYREISDELKISHSSIIKIIGDAKKEGKYVSEQKNRLDKGFNHYFTHLYKNENLTHTERKIKSLFESKKLNNILLEAHMTMDKSDILSQSNPYQSLLYAVFQYPEYPSDSTFIQDFVETHHEYTQKNFKEYLKIELLQQWQKCIIHPDHIDEQEVDKAIKSLKEKDEYVIRKIYFEKLSRKELADEMGLSRPYIYKLEAKALRSMRNIKIRRKLQRYVYPEKMLEYAHGLEEKIAGLTKELSETKDRLKKTEEAIASTPMFKYLSDLYRETNKYEPRDEVFDMDVEELDLGVRSTNTLRTLNILTIRQLVQKHGSELLKVKNFGRKSLNEINKELSNLGLSLGMKLE